MLVRAKGCWLPWILLLTLGIIPVPGRTQSLARTAAGGPAEPGANAAAQGTQTLDLNTATAEQLKTLPGVGEAYAKRIVDGRPYTAKNQLVSKGILPQSTYDRIKDNVVAHRLTKR